MRKNELNNDESINKILDLISNSGKNGEIEFEFGTPTEEEGLVFENSDDDEEVAEAPAKVSFDDTKEPEDDPYESEFTLPTSFNSTAPKASVTSSVEEAPRIHTTYIPRFTGASLSYRMKDDPRPRGAVEAPELPAVTVKVEQPKQAVVEPVVAVVDPIEEIEEVMEAPAAVTVNNNGGAFAGEIDTSSKMFKFEFGEEPVSQPSEPEEETSAEEAAFEEIVNSMEEEPVTDDSEISSAAEFADKSPEMAFDAKEFFIPDPEIAKPAIIDYTVSSTLAGGPAVEDAPVGVGDGTEKFKKRRKSEYSNYAERDTFKDKFLDSIMSIRVRFYAGAIVALVLLILEGLFALGVDLPKHFNMATVPGAMAILDLQLVVCLYFLSIPEIIQSIKGLVRKKAVSELNITASLVAYIVYCLVVISRSPRIYPLFGLVFAITVLASIGSTYFRKVADFTAFKVVSVHGEKKIIDRKFTRTLQLENAALDGKIEEHKSKIVRIFRTLFVSNFFERAERDGENTRGVLLILGSSFGVAAVTGVVAFFVPGGTVNAFSAFAFVFMMAIPAMMLLTHKLPFFYSEKEAEKEKCTAIGEAAMIDYSGVDVVTFNDTEVFGEDDVNLQRIMLYGQSDNLSKALRQMSMLFMNVGGPLDRLFSNSLDRKCAPAQGVFIEADGVGGIIDGKTVLAGNMEFMLRKGVRILEDDGKNQAVASASTKIMFAAEDGVVYAKFYIRYSFSEEFSMLLPILEDEGVTPLVCTRDPNITGELIRTLTAGMDKIRVIKKQDSPFGDTVVYRNVSAGIVTTGDKNNAINMLLLTKKYAKLQSRFEIVEYSSAIAGGVFAIVLALSGQMILPSVIFAAWHAAWCGALHLVSAKIFGWKK